MDDFAFQTGNHDTNGHTSTGAEDDTAGGLVSISELLLSSPANTALIEAVVSVVEHLTVEEVQAQVVDGWTNGLRPVRAIADRWGPGVVAKAAGRHSGYARRTPDPSNISPETAALIPIEASRRCHLVVVAADHETKQATICAVDPTNQATRDEVHFYMSDWTVRWAIADEHAIHAALQAVESRSLVDTSEFVTTEEQDLSIGVDQDDADSHIVRYLDSAFNEAVALNVSDIHFFPQPEGYEIRQRRDGVLVFRERVSEKFGRGLVSRVRVLCSMAVSSNNKQDGGAAISVNGQRIDLRVSIIPTIWPLPAMTIRILASRQDFMQLKNLYSDAFLERYVKAVNRPAGFNLIVGQTGDGKPLATTTPVLMGDGTRRQLGDIRAGDTVITDQGVPRTVTAVHEQGPLDCVDIVTRSGRAVTAALDHPFLTPDGWVEAQHLTAQHTLLSISEPATDSPAHPDTGFVLAGIVCAAGTLRDDNTIVIEGCNQDVTDPTVTAAKQHGFDVTPAPGGFGIVLDRKAGEWLRAHGVTELGSEKQTIPSFVFEGTPDQIRMFLGAHVAGAGTIRMSGTMSNGTTVTAVEHNHQDPDLLADLQHLYLRTGIQTALHQTPTGWWRLTVDNATPSNLHRAAQLPVLGAKHDLLAAHTPDVDPTITVDPCRMPDPIATITPSGQPVECRCLTVDEHSTFTAADLIVHNSTTLAATLNEIATPQRKAMAVEDPVENRLPHIVQVQVNRAAGLTWLNALEGFLRSDPDIVMVGEIRDADTARISTQAAQTGHLVLGTLHIVDAASAPSRLAGDFGIPLGAIADTLNTVLAQRLLRLLCRECRIPITYSTEQLAEFGWPDTDEAKDVAAHASFYEAHILGCDACDYGYKGRKAAPELLVVSDQIRDAILDGQPAFKIRQIALEEGMQPMWQTAFGMVANGETTFEEVLASIVVPQH